MALFLNSFFAKCLRVGEGYLCHNATFLVASETLGPIEVRSFVKHLYLTETKFYMIGPSHMTKMVIYDDPGLTFTYFKVWSYLVPKAFE